MPFRQIKFELDASLTTEIHVHLSDGTVFCYQFKQLTCAEVQEAMARALFFAGRAVLDTVCLPEAFRQFQPTGL